MSRTLVVLLSHDLTPAQIEAARTELGVDHGRIVLLPAHLRAQWMNVPPDGELGAALLVPIITWVTESTQPGDAVLVQGEPGMQTAIVRAAQRAGRVAVYSTTRRESVEEVATDGSVRKVSRFAHVRFREYPSP